MIRAARLVVVVFCVWWVFLVVVFVLPLLLNFHVLLLKFLLITTYITSGCVESKFCKMPALWKILIAIVCSFLNTWNTVTFIKSFCLCLCTCPHEKTFKSIPRFQNSLQNKLDNISNLFPSCFDSSGVCSPGMLPLRRVCFGHFYLQR